VTVDVIALCERQPDPATTLAAMQTCGPDLRLTALERGSLLQLCADDGRPLVTVEGPRLVQVPGEAERLLGVEGAPHPAWWVEARAADPGAAAIARRFAAALLSQTGGVSWSSR
jgi:hypothetical protein